MAVFDKNSINSTLLLLTFTTHIYPAVLKAMSILCILTAVDIEALKESIWHVLIIDL